MADFEDSNAPTWDNVVLGQVNVRDAVNRTISFTNEKTGKSYRLNEKIATLLVRYIFIYFFSYIVRPRGWHMEEKHFLIDGVPISASLFDFGLYFFHNAENTVKQGFGPYFYLPKLESHLEAR